MLEPMGSAKIREVTLMRPIHGMKGERLVNYEVNAVMSNKADAQCQL